MTTTKEAIILAVREFLLERLPGETAQTLADDVPLISSGRVDSLMLVSLVELLEERYQIEVLPHEMDAAHMETLADIAQLVLRKR
jgi:acyl carrier protein